VKYRTQRAKIPSKCSLPGMENDQDKAIPVDNDDSRLFSDK
jgi:hypothetical protein